MEEKTAIVLMQLKWQQSSTNGHCYSKVSAMATICQCQQVSGTKNLAYQIRLKQRTGADYMGKNWGQSHRDSLEGLEYRATTFEGIS